MPVRVPSEGDLRDARYSRSKPSNGFLDGTCPCHGQHDWVGRIPVTRQPCALGVEFRYWMVDHHRRRIVRGIGVWRAQQGIAKGRRSLCLHARSLRRWRGLCNCMGLLDFDVGRKCRHRHRCGKLSEPIVSGCRNAWRIVGSNDRDYLGIYAHQHSRHQVGRASSDRLDDRKAAASGRGDRACRLCPCDPRHRACPAICDRRHFRDQHFHRHHIDPMGHAWA